MGEATTPEAATAVLSRAHVSAQSLHEGTDVVAQPLSSQALSTTRRSADLETSQSEGRADSSIRPMVGTAYGISSEGTEGTVTLNLVVMIALAACGGGIIVGAVGLY